MFDNILNFSDKVQYLFFYTVLRDYFFFFLWMIPFLISHRFVHQVKFQICEKNLNMMDLLFELKYLYIWSHLFNGFSIFYWMSVLRKYFFFKGSQFFDCAFTVKNGIFGLAMKIELNGWLISPSSNSLFFQKINHSSNNFFFWEGFSFHLQFQAKYAYFNHLIILLSQKTFFCHFQKTNDFFPIMLIFFRKWSFLFNRKFRKCLKIIPTGSASRYCWPMDHRRWWHFFHLQWSMTIGHRWPSLNYERITEK